MGAFIGHCWIRVHILWSHICFKKEPFIRVKYLGHKNMSDIWVAYYRSDTWVTQVGQIYIYIYGSHKLVRYIGHMNRSADIWVAQIGQIYGSHKEVRYGGYWIFEMILMHRR